MYSKNSFIMLALVLSLIGFSGVEAYSAAVEWDGEAATNNWFDAANWNPNVVPDDDDDVTIGNGFTVDVNGAVDILSLTIDGTLRPDASAARTMRIRTDLILESNGSIAYTDAGGTGRLSWTFDGQTGGTDKIDNQTGDEANLQFYDVTFTGTIVTDNNANDGDFEVYGDFTVNGAFQPNDGAVANSTVHFVGIDVTNTITNNGTLEFVNVAFESDANFTSNSDITIDGNLTIESGSTLSLTNPSILTTAEGLGQRTYTNGGTLTFGAGTSWNIDEDLLIDGNITGIAGDVLLTDATLTITAQDEIAGTGSFTTSGTTPAIVVSDGSGVAGAIDFDTYTWDADTDVTILEGTTGFTDAELQIFDNLFLGEDTGAALLITINDSFTITGDLTVVENALGATTVSSSSGTVSMTTGSSTITVNNETLGFNSLVIGDGNSSTVTLEEDQGFSINEDLLVSSNATLDAVAGTSNHDFITFNGVSTLTVEGTLEAPDYGDIEVTGNLTLASAVDLGANIGTTDGAVNLAATGTLDFSSFVLNMQSASFTTQSGSLLKTSAATGFAGNITSSTLSIDTGTNLEYNSGALATGLENVDGAGTDITSVDNITVDGANISGNLLDDASSTFTLGGDFTLSSGTFNLVAANNDVLNFTGGGNIVNSTGTASNLSFANLLISGGTITVNGDFYINSNNGDALNVTGTLDATTNDAHIYFDGDGNASIDGAGAINFHDITIEANTAIDATATNVNIAGDLTVATGVTLTGAAASHVTFNGTGTQTITDADGDNLSLDLVTVNSGATVETASSFIVGNDAGAITINGSFTQSSGTITASGSNTITVGASGSAEFFVFDAGTLTELTDGDMSIVKELGGAAFTLNSSGGNLTFLGDPAVTDAIAADGDYFDDEKKEASITVTNPITTAGTLVVAEDCELQVGVNIAGAGPLSILGRLEVNTDGITIASAVTNTGELHLTNTGGTSDLTDIFTGTLTTSAGDVIIDGDHTTIVGEDLEVNNLIFNSTGAMALENGDNITLNGNLIIEGTDFATGDESSTISFAGSTPQTVTGSSTFSVGEIIVNAGADVDLTHTGVILLEKTSNEVFTVQSTGDFSASSGTITFNAAADAGTANIVNGNADGTGLVFHDVEIAAAATGVDFATPFTIGGSLFHNSGGLLAAADATSDITFNGANEQIVVDDNAQLTFFDVIIDGSYTVDGTAGTELINVLGDFTVTGNGSLAMTDGGITFGDGGTTSGTDEVSIINNGGLQFHDLVINKEAATDDVSTDDNYTINGDLTVTQGEFRNTSNIVTFEGSSTFLSEGAPASATFNDINFDGSTTLGDGNLDISVTGDVVVSSGNTAISSAINDKLTFIGSTSKNIVNDGTLSFGIVTIADEANNDILTEDSFSISGSFSVGGNNGGSFEATAGAVSFNSSTTQTIINNGEAADLKFHGFTGTGSSTSITVANNNIFINGDITLEDDAVLDFHTNDLRVFLNGSSQQTISLNGTGTAGTSGRLFLHDVTLNNEDGLLLNGLNSDIADDQLDVEGILRLQNGDIDLNGNNIITIDVTNGGDLDETAGNTVVNTGASNGTGNVYATQTAPVLSNKDFGGLGMIITTNPTNAIAGDLTVRRYHIPREIGGENQISRYYQVTENDGSLDARISLRWDDSELGPNNKEDLVLLYADDITPNSPWVKQESVIDTSLNRLTATGIDAFTGGTEWWTAGAPNELSATQLTDGLAESTLGAGTNDNAIFGVQFTATGEIGLESVQFDFGRNLTDEPFSNYELIYSADTDYSTLEDNVSLISGTFNMPNTISGGTNTDDFISFDVSGLNSDYNTVDLGSEINYFLVVDVAENLNLNTSTITPQLTEAEVAWDGGVTNPFALTGTTYDFEASIEIEPNENGIEVSPLAAGQQDAAIFGFKAEITNIASLPGFTGFTLDFEGDPSEVFSNVRLYESDDSDFNTTGDNDEITLTTETITENSIVFAFAEQDLAIEPQYYFVAVDVKNNVNSSTNAVTPTLVYESIQSSNAQVRGTDGDGNPASSHTGYTYDFVESTVTLSTDNNPSAGVLGTDLEDQPLFGFTLTPDEDQTVEFTQVIINVALSNANQASNFDRFKLFRDTNGNGYGDDDDAVNYNGVYNNGVLTFTGFSESISEATEYVVVARVRSGAAAGTTIGLSIATQDFVTLTSPAKVNDGGPFPATAKLDTVRTAGDADALEIVDFSEVTISGETNAITVRAIDENGYPTKVSATTEVTIASAGGDGTITGTTTGDILSGKGFVVISPELQHPTVSTNLLIDAEDTNPSNLTTSEDAGPITILEEAPTDNGGVVTIDESLTTATSLRMSNLTAPSSPGDGRIVVMRQGGRPVAPTNGVLYTPSSDIALAGGVGVGQTAPGSYVVYNQAGGASVSISQNVTNLTPDQRYYFMVFEYTGSGSNLTYATATAFTNDDNQNPTSAKTADGTYSNSDASNASFINTDIDISSSIDASGDVDWFIFKLSGNKNNARVIVSNLPANYNLEIYDGSGGVNNLELLRQSELNGNRREVLILNDVDLTANDTFYIKIYGNDDDQFSASNYNLRVSTRSDEFYSLTEE